MRALIQTIRDSFVGKASNTNDPVREFFAVRGEGKRRGIYEEALRAAQADQRKILEKAA